MSPRSATGRVQLSIAGVFFLVIAAGWLAMGSPGLRPDAADAAHPPGTLHFDDTTDTIQVAGQTVLGVDSTYEARIFFPAGTGGFGVVFNEWTDFAEDKYFAIGPALVQGYNHPLLPILQHNAVLGDDAWHHVAFVQDSSTGQQRMYVDGALVASQSVAGDIADGVWSPFVGAIGRGSVMVRGSFRGYIDTLRISDTARYSGTSFSPPAGDLSDDDNALLLYNFSAADFVDDNGVIKVADLSGNGHTGSLGQGFGGATSPLLHQPDTDGDGVPDAIDNCVAMANPVQLNTDAANTAANRPGTDGLGDACDGDIDGDGYTNAQETALVPGKNPNIYCDIMRADVDGDHAVTILDMTVVAGQFLTNVPPAPERLKQDADNAITILDLTAMANLFLNNVSACP